MTPWFGLELIFLVQLFAIKQHCEEATVNLFNNPCVFVVFFNIEKVISRL
jgi:fumarate reductase subunit C